MNKTEIETRLKEMLKNAKCTETVPAYYIEAFSRCYARFLECEEQNDKYGLVVKQPKTGSPIPSPLVEIGQQYLKSAMEIWKKIQANVYAYMPNCDINKMLDECVLRPKNN